LTPPTPRRALARTKKDTPTPKLHLDQPRSFRDDNFISNALRAAPPGSSIEVGANTNGEHVVCRVADRGPGLSTVDRERAFERFWRARSAADGGSGLGLAIVTRLAELSDAHVALHERDGGGLIAEVALRRAHSH
jgi:signal transduction histidine kinase